MEGRTRVNWYDYNTLHEDNCDWCGGDLAAGGKFLSCVLADVNACRTCGEQYEKLRAETARAMGDSR